MRRIVMAQPKLIGWKGDDGSIIRISAGIGSEHDVPDEVAARLIANDEAFDAASLPPGLRTSAPVSTPGVRPAAQAQPVASASLREAPPRLPHEQPAPLPRGPRTSLAQRLT
jgi:hypothetical protein